MATTTIPQNVAPFDNNLAYSWTQTLRDVEINLSLPTPVKSSKELKIAFKPRHISCTRAGEEKPFFEVAPAASLCWTKTDRYV